jgi:hypothetical protein
MNTVHGEAAHFRAFPCDHARSWASHHADICCGSLMLMAMTLHETYGRRFGGGTTQQIDCFEWG